MIFITDILIHFVIRKHFSNQRWWLFKFSKGYPLELSPFWAKNEILNIQNLTSNNKMYQNSRLKTPKTSTCLFVKKCHNSCLELGNIKLMTLYLTFTTYFSKLSKINFCGYLFSLKTVNQIYLSVLITWKNILCFL